MKMKIPDFTASRKNVLFGIFGYAYLKQVLNDVVVSVRA